MNFENLANVRLFRTLFPGCWRRVCIRSLALLLMLLMSGSISFAYSVLTHEEIVDLLWTGEIRPLLLKRFPELTEEQLKEAHAYAYGGAVIQDLGYYPFGSTEFSDLGALRSQRRFCSRAAARESGCQRIRFCLGALAHYAVGYRRASRCQSGRRHPVSETAREIRQFGAICRGSHRAFENGIRIRHGAGSQESLRLAAVSRLHRIPGL